MPRSITLGNGHMLIGLDERAQVRDWYFPFVGLENHVGVGHVHRLGVFADGRLSWLEDPSWRITLDYEKETSAGKVSAVNDSLGIELSLSDAVYNERNIFLRAATLNNLRAGTTREVKLFFAHQFELSESHRGDTAYFDPRFRAIVHYKGRRVFLINARRGKEGFDDYSVGLFEVEGKEGTHIDAQDGVLSKNPIEHGTVDSAIGLTVSLAAGEPALVHYWVAVGESLADAQAHNTYVLEKTPEHLMRTTRDFWRAWVNRQNFSFYGLDEATVALFKKSLLIIRAHADNNGAIIASSDSDMLQHGRDSYSYVWPRDGAYAAMALDRAGDFNVARKFFEFCDAVATDKGYLMHKYRPDLSLGSSWEPWLRNGKAVLPIQEDETAIVLVALWKHYRLTKDIEFVESVYNTLVRGIAEFLTEYVDAKTGLPYPSYDLWEQDYGITTYTVSVKYGALIAAANFAHLLGKEAAAKRYNDAAQATREAILTKLYDPKEHRFLKSLAVGEGGALTPSGVIDMSSFYGVFRFGVLPPEDERVRAMLRTVEERLLLREGVRGVPRFEHDDYYRPRGVAQPNPWFVTTLWLAQYHIAVAKTEPELAAAREWIAWTVAHALPSGVLSEQVDPWSGAQVSAAPLVWSHAEFVHTVIDYLERLELMGLCIACNPVTSN